MSDHITIKTKVAAIEFKTRVVSVHHTGKLDAGGKPEFHSVVEDLGWFVCFERSHESLFFGMDKPKTEVGRPAIIRITLE